MRLVYAPPDATFVWPEILNAVARAIYKRDYHAAMVTDSAVFDVHTIGTGFLAGIVAQSLRETVIESVEYWWKTH